LTLHLHIPHPCREGVTESNDYGLLGGVEMSEQVLRAGGDDSAGADRANQAGFLREFTERAGLRGMMALAALVIVSAGGYGLAYLLLASFG